MKISIIGAGAMGGSLAEGLLKTDLLQAGDITVADPTQDVLDRFAAEGVSVTTDNNVAVVGADIVMVVVKPWIVEQVLEGVKASLDYDKQVLVIIAAGISSDSVRTWLDKDGAAPHFFLAIPNIGIAEKASMTFLVPVGATQAETRRMTDIFEQLGGALVTEERLLASGTTLASCGIAYAMRYIRASVEGGVELGFKAADATKIVLQTVEGAVRLLQASGEHPEAAIDKVTTPGGVTIKGLNAMEHYGFTNAVIEGLKAGAKA